MGEHAALLNVVTGEQEFNTVDQTMKRLASLLLKRAFSLLALAIVLAPQSGRASVTFEFQLGAVPIPGNSLGVIVADTGADGFTSPNQAAGTVLTAGNPMGAGNDRIISVFPITAGDPFTGGGGFAEFVGPLDYAALGVVEGQALIFYAFPGRAPGSEIRSGETFVSFRTEQAGQLIGNMDFTLPEDGGSYSLGVLEPALGGGADFTGLLPATPLMAVEDSPDLIVGKRLELQLEGTGNPSLYIVRGLPPGLRLDPRTGLISGRLRKAGTFQLKVSMRNSAGTSGPLLVGMEVASLPAEVIGNFQGLVARDEAVNESLGGKLALRTAPNGQLSGRLTLGRRSYGFRGDLDAEIVSGVPADTGALVTIPRRGMDPLFLDLSFDLDSQSILGRVDDAGESAGVEGFRHVWHPRLNRPAAYEGYYTAWMDLDATQGLEGVVAVPQGNGYLGLTVPANGTARWVGRLADGSPLASAGFLGPNGEYCVWRGLYGNTGSIIGSGAVVSDPGNDGDFADNAVDGQWDWMKRPQANPRQRVYRDGFGVAASVVQLVEGERYSAPARGEILLGLPAVDNNVRVSFTEGGMGDSLTNPDLTFTVNAGARGIVPRPGTVENPARTVFTVNRRTGLFRGSFLLQDTDPVTGRPLRRPVAYLGMLRPSLEMGVGYFLLGQIPIPASDPPQNPRNTPILSGQVLLEAAD